MISHLAIPPGEVSAAALLLVVGPGLTGVCVTKEVEGVADAFLLEL
jgi:hypothetical protein